MELKLYQKDIHPANKDTSIDDLTEEDFGFAVDNMFNLMDRITYHCPTGFIKYLKHEDKNLIGKIGVENLSEESLQDYDYQGFSIPMRRPFLDGIYDELNEISNRQIITKFVERKSISNEEYRKERNRLSNIRNYDLPAKLEKAISEIRPKFVEDMDISKYTDKKEHSNVYNFKSGILKLAVKETLNFFISECIGFDFEEYKIFQKKTEEFRKIYSNEYTKVAEEIEALDRTVN